MTREEQLQKLDAMAKPRSEEAIKKAEDAVKCIKFPYNENANIEIVEL